VFEAHGVTPHGLVESFVEFVEQRRFIMSKTCSDRQKPAIVTTHARERFNERFPDIRETLESLLSEAIPFGGQKGNEYLLLNTEHGILFPMGLDEKTGRPVVKTVLTHDQGMGTFSLKMPKVLASREVNNLTQGEIRARQESIAKEQEDSEILGVIKLAREHAEACRFQFPDRDTQKVIMKEIRAEHGISRRTLEKIYWPEFGRLVYKHNANLGLVAGNAV